MLLQKVHHLILVVVGHGDVLVAEDDAQAVDRLHLGHVDDIAAVGAQELGVGEVVLQTLHGHERHHLLTRLQVEAYVVLQSLDIENIVEVEAQQLVFALHKEETVLQMDVLLLLCGEQLQRLVRGLQEVLIADGLQQVVERTDTEAFDGILREGCGKDDLCLMGQDLGELDTTEFWHLDIQEQQLYGVVTHVAHSRL